MEKFKLPKKFAEEWIQALRSGKYEQGKANLFNDNSYCCLGVACHIKGIKNEEIEDQPFIDAEYLEPEVLYKIKDIIPDELIGEGYFVLLLASLNDGCTVGRIKDFKIPVNKIFGKKYSEQVYFSFLEIADFIEQNVELY